MPTIQLEASAGEVLTGYLPTGWAEVPFPAYLAFVATARPLRHFSAAHAYFSQAGCQALAHLLGLPTGAPLYHQPHRLGALHALAPWLFEAPQPEVTPLVPNFTYRGTHYRYAPAAELGPVAAATRERVLLWYLRETDGNPVPCAAQLLATLYTPGGAPPSEVSDRAGTQAFQALPVSLVWPCLRQFLVSETLAPDPVTRYQALRPMVAQALAGLEAAVAAAPPPARLAPVHRWLATAWQAWRRRRAAPVFLS